MVKNQTSMMGPNSFPTVPVPCFCTAKSTRRMTHVIGITAGSNFGLSTSSPSIALRTEIAGVIAPSP